MQKFNLSDAWIEQYKNKKPDFGPLGEFVYLRTYSRVVEGENRNEQWWETIRRVVEGCFSIQKEHCAKLRLPWKSAKAQKSAQVMFDKIFSFKFLPPGRGLWMMGTKFVEERGSSALNNCGAISTEDIDTRGSFAFTWTMDALMLGVGIGFDTKGAGKITIKQAKSGDDLIFKIPDSREGWVESVGMTIDAYFLGKKLPKFDYSLIRPYGSPIKGFGGVASGPEPLKNLNENLVKMFETKIGEELSSVDIVDVFNMIGVCVVAGNVRRSAEIAIGDYTDKLYTSMKDPEKYSNELKTHRWASNNSVFVEIGKTNYKDFVGAVSSNGEPGFIWLENIKKYGRTKDGENWIDKNACLVNPCSEQTLESAELCVSGNTRIQTRNGNPFIKDVEGKEVEIWNGDKWSKVVPFGTGRAKLYRVYLSDGSYLDATAGHGWHVKPNSKKIFRRVETKNLEIGSQSISFSLDKIEGKFEPLAYEYGLFSGDGYIDGDRPMLCVCGEKSKLKDLDIKGVWYKKQIKEGYTEPYNRLSFKNVLDFEKAKELNNKTLGFPNWIFEMDKNSILNFVAGLIETDGNLCHQLNTDNYRIFGNEEKIRDLQLLLRRVGINHSSIYKVGNKGEETNFGIRNYDLYCCYIPSFECGKIPTRIKIAERIGSKYKKNNAYKISKLIDASRKQRIVKIEEISENDTFCFTEPENNMGVFGNVLTYQCCLVETFPSRHETFEEYKETLKYAYLYAKTVTLMPTHWEETNAVMMKNRRIGTSMSGIIDAFVKHGRRKILNWADEGYTYLKQLDEIYSNWLCIPKSIKITSVKPSGSVSLLPGVSPGIHYPHSEYYIRRVRIASNSPLVEPMIKAGYHVETSVYGSNQEEKDKTSIISFPVWERNFVRRKEDVSIWEQVKNAVDFQRFWADNNVSITVTFKPEEQNQIASVLEAYEDTLKAISFLPLNEHNYQQAPYEEITKEQYVEMSKGLKVPDFSFLLTKPEGESYCDGDACILPIDVKVKEIQ